MESRVKLLGHPIHPKLIPFPLGLFITATIFDVIYLVNGNSDWMVASFYMILGGLVGGVVAAVFGAIEYLAIPRKTRAKRVATAHGIGNVVVILIFGLSFIMRLPDRAAPEAFATGLAVLGLIILTATGWMGGELVNRMGVGVDDGANVNAPSSLKKGPAAAP